MNSSRKSYIFAILAILFWATIPTAFKTGLHELSILTLLTVASCTSTAALLVITVFSGKLSLVISSTPANLVRSAVLGLINPFIYYLILLRAYSLLPAQVAQPLNMIWPIILVFLSVPVLGHKIAARSYLALFISFIGVYIISSQGNLLHPVRANYRGVLLATGSSVFWATYFILNVKDKRDESVKLLLNFFFGSLYLMAAILITGNHELHGSIKGFSAAVYTGLFEMGVTFLFWLKALELAPDIARISNLVYIAPFLSLILVNIILHEKVYVTTPVGLVFIISGILIQNFKQAENI